MENIKTLKISFVVLTCLVQYWLIKKHPKFILAIIIVGAVLNTVFILMEKESEGKTNG